MKNKYVYISLTGIKRDLPTETLYLKVPIKEIYVATNNLDELNYIGEGTAGERI